jgi:Uma2 family endonuclease
MAARRKAATYADLEKVPDTMVAEILDGELVVSPRPALRHANTGSMLVGDLIFHFGGGGGSGAPGGWWILYEPELHFKHDVLVPDLAGWRRERMPKLPNVAACTLAPDWVCEIISDRTARYDRGRKKRIYARERIQHLWHIDPIARLLETFTLDGKRWLDAGTYEGEAKVRVPPFEARPVNLGRLWLPE